MGIAIPEDHLVTRLSLGLLLGGALSRRSDGGHAFVPPVVFPAGGLLR
jgi:hypothetical protein